MKLLALVLCLFSLNVFAVDSNDEVLLAQPPAELKTPNQEVIDKHHQPGGALKVKKGPVKIPGLNSTPAEKAATEKALRDAQKKPKEENQQIK